MTGSRSAYTRKRILEAATRLFAVKGDKTSLREITAEAQVNVSAVNYHFGSREGLITAVYQHRIEVLKQAQIRLLEQLETEAKAAGRPAIEPRKLVEAYFRPFLQHTVGEIGAPPGQAPQDSNALVRTLALIEHGEVLERYRAAFAQSLPDIPEAELEWRILFMFAAASSAYSGSDGLLFAFSRKATEPLTLELLIERLIPFLVGGLLAPLPSPLAGSSAAAANAHGVSDVSHSD